MFSASEAVREAVLLKKMLFLIGMGAYRTGSDLVG